METFIILVVLLVIGAVLLAVFTHELGTPAADTPTRCPTCKRDGLARVATPINADVEEIFECPHCGARFSRWELRG